MWLSFRQWLTSNCISSVLIGGLVCLRWWCWWHFLPNIDPWITWRLLVSGLGSWHICISRFHLVRWSVRAQRDLFWFAEALRGRVWPSIRIMIRINIIRTKLKTRKYRGCQIMVTCSELVFGWGCLVWFPTNPTVFPTDLELLFSFDFDIDNASEKDKTSTSLPIYKNHFEKLSGREITKIWNFMMACLLIGWRVPPWLLGLIVAGLLMRRYCSLKLGRLYWGQLRSNIVSPVSSVDWLWSLLKWSSELFWVLFVERVFPAGKLRSLPPL